MSGSYGSEGIMKIIEHQGNGINYYTLVNNHHMSVTIMDWGATVTAIKTHDKDGNFANIVLGFDDGADYITYQSFSVQPSLGLRGSSKMPGGGSMT